MIRSKETLGASCGSGGSADPCGSSAGSSSGAFSSAEYCFRGSGLRRRFPLLLRYRLVREVDDLGLGRLVLLRQQRAAGGKYLLQHLRRGNPYPPGRRRGVNRSPSGCLGGLRRSRGLRFSVGLRLCGSFLLSRGFCRSRLRGVFLRRQILRPVQAAAAAELRQNILQG